MIMTPKESNQILFLADVPSHAASQILLVSDNEHKKSYKEAIALPAGAFLTYPSDFSDESIPENSIAYHPVYGFITYSNRWKFSTRQFITDLQAADENPNIRAHLIHIDSGGGEAFGLHEAFLAVKALKKPCYAVIESLAGSAGYYLAAAADKIYATSIFSEVGSIGMVGIFYDNTKQLKDEGIEKRTYYSNYSPLKNKIANDALAGDGDEYIKNFLDPMALQFIEDVCSVRPELTQEAKEGQIYYALRAQEAGLIDGQYLLNEVIDLLDKVAPITKQSPSVDINKLNF